MKQTGLNLNEYGLRRIQCKKILDERGIFKKVYFTESEIKKYLPDIKELFFTYSKKGTIRGMHLQGPEHEMQKIIMVIDGVILDVIVDCNKDSANYGTFFKIELDKNSEAIYIPKGFAHGYQVLSENAIVMYGADEDFCSKCDVGFNISSLELNWPIKEKIMSKKDSDFVDFKNFNYFEKKFH